ncbi:hypothetical protein RN001_014402 [Aquatica leii]|uniref:Ig-like domain-containing protein n=1 Tax=Aquatica leii TaxID=1421715 RepID=A0AAN7QBM4_9COLE|nr:hypothetical protein RN001_014402 [Aquatica leii]
MNDSSYPNDTDMKLLAVVITTIWVHYTCGRRLGDDFNNDVSENRNNDWVRLSKSPSNILTRLHGSHVELECEAMGSPAPVIQWLKDSTPLIEDDSLKTNILDDSSLHGMAKTRSRLVIYSAHKIHEAVYTCIAKAGSELASAYTKLLLLVNNHVEMNYTQFFTMHTPARIVQYNTIYLDDIGNDIALSCKAVGKPTPDIIWIDPLEQVIENDGRLTISSDGQLKIRNIKWDDMGGYTCVARNSIGEDTISTFLYPMLPIEIEIRDIEQNQKKGETEYETINLRRPKIISKYGQKLEVEYKEIEIDRMVQELTTKIKKATEKKTYRRKEKEIVKKDNWWDEECKKADTKNIEKMRKRKTEKKSIQRNVKTVQGNMQKKIENKRMEEEQIKKITKESDIWKYLHKERKSGKKNVIPIKEKGKNG